MGHQARGLLPEFGILNITKQAGVQNYQKHVQMLGFQFSADCMISMKGKPTFFLDKLQVGMHE